VKRAAVFLTGLAAAKSLALALAIALPLPLALALAMAPAAAAECRLALALAVDVSRSVDARDYAIQRDGLAAALRDPGVRRAFFAGAPVALAVYEWGGVEMQEVVVDWQLVTGEAVLDAAAARIAGLPAYERFQPTALGDALAFGQRMLDAAPPCAAQGIDVSGDGRNNAGLPPHRIYARIDFGATVVNALAIGEHERDLAAYYAAEVIRGPGAFVEQAASQADFPRAIRRKLIRELTLPVFGGGPQPGRPGG
jgi:hypothetical protein